MKTKHMRWICSVLLLALLPVYALAGSGCDTGNHDLAMVDVKYPTCTTDGYYILECNACNYRVKEINGTATGHDWQDDGTVYPDCENPGLEKMVCANCGDVWTNVIPAIGHTFGEKEIFQDATCEMAGTATATCESCGKTLLYTIDPKGHSWKNTRIIKEATCKTEGKAESVCRECGYETTRTLKKTAHTYTEWHITKPATSTSKGTRTATCDVCGKKITEKYELPPSNIGIYTSAAKVNLRSGAGKNYKQVTQVAKKDTYLGQLIGAKADKNGDVWFNIKYNGKNCWVMAKYATTVVETPETPEERYPEASNKEMTNYFLKSSSVVADMLKLEKAPDSEEDAPEWMNDVMHVAGEPYVDQIAVFGKGYTMCGVKVGDRIKDAQKAVGKHGLVLYEAYGNEYVYRIPALPGSLTVAEDGCCGYFIIIVDDNNKVEAIKMYTDGAEYHWSGV